MINDDYMKESHVRSGQLKTAAEIACGKHMPSAQRLTELAEAGLAPHYRIDGGPPLFYVNEIKNWIAAELTHHQPGKPVDLLVASRPSDASLERRPDSLAQLENLKEIPCPHLGPGIYFLCVDAELRYIGQSINPFSRIGQHSKVKKFSRVFFLPCPASELDTLERKFIAMLQPPDNRVGILKAVK